MGDRGGRTVVRVTRQCRQFAIQQDSSTSRFQSMRNVYISRRQMPMQVLSVPYFFAGADFALSTRFTMVASSIKNARVMLCAGNAMKEERSERDVEASGRAGGKNRRKDNDQLRSLVHKQTNRCLTQTAHREPPYARETVF